MAKSFSLYCYSNITTSTSSLRSAYSTFSRVDTARRSRQLTSRRFLIAITSRETTLFTSPPSRIKSIHLAMNASCRRHLIMPPGIFSFGSNVIRKCHDHDENGARRKQARSEETANDKSTRAEQSRSCGSCHVFNVSKAHGDDNVVRCVLLLTIWVAMLDAQGK